MLSVPILSNQFADILARCAVTARTDLTFYEVLEGCGKRDVHCAHGAVLALLAKFGRGASGDCGASPETTVIAMRSPLHFVLLFHSLVGRIWTR